MVPAWHWLLGVIPYVDSVGEMIDFFVNGKPEPGGSKRPFTLKTGQTVVVDANKNVGSWKDTVRNAAVLEMGICPPLVCAVVAQVTFYLRRPKGHYGSGKNAGILKASAPAYPTTKPDTTKLWRSTEDALKGVVWRDDSMVVREVIQKEYADHNPEGARIQVYPAIVLSLMLMLWAPAWAQSPDTIVGATTANGLTNKHVVLRETIENKPAVYMSLIKAHREGRNWKTAWLKPGREYSFFYRCVDAEGHEYIKQLPAKLTSAPGFNIPDDRSFGERHPNVAAVNAVAGFTMAPLLGVLVGVVKK